MINGGIVLPGMQYHSIPGESLWRRKPTREMTRRTLREPSHEPGGSIGASFPSGRGRSRWNRIGETAQVLPISDVGTMKIRFINCKAGAGESSAANWGGSKAWTA
jgi:hypothetical protein